MLNKNRLDVFFSTKPSDDILKQLKDRCFSFDYQRICWYNKDTDVNREFLKHYFNADFPEVKPIDIQSGQLAIKAPNLPVVESDESGDTNTKGTPEYLKYKHQVNRLIDALGIDAADLILLAIDTLYREKIGIEQ